MIRASALRVLSSIRVPIIVPIMMLAIKEAASDMSPYVRKTAAHAIPKLYRYGLGLPSLQGDQLLNLRRPPPLRSLQAASRWLQDSGRGWELGPHLFMARVGMQH